VSRDEDTAQKRLARRISENPEAWWKNRPIYLSNVWGWKDETMKELHNDLNAAGYYSKLGRNGAFSFVTVRRVAPWWVRQWRKVRGRPSVAAVEGYAPPT
jgi:hypothetical protein